MNDTDIVYVNPVEVSNAGTNGGRMGTELITSGEVNNVIPHIDRATRSAGNLSDPIKRKIFCAVRPSILEGLLSTLTWLERVLDSGDFVTFHAGTQSDTQADLTGSERHYGYAFLKSDITVGDDRCIVTCKNALQVSGARQIFQVGDKIRPSTMQSPAASTGNEEFDLEIDSITTNGLDMTLILPSGVTFANSYLADDSGDLGFVVSYKEEGDVECSVSGYTVTLAGTGDYAYNSGSYPVTPDPSGTVYDTVVCTWQNATTFEAIGQLSGINYGNGTFSADFAPVDGDSNIYFTLEAAGHSGTPEAGDEFEFDISPSSFSKWLYVWVPPSCASLANNKATFVTAGESPT